LPTAVSGTLSTNRIRSGIAKRGKMPRSTYDRRWAWISSIDLEDIISEKKGVRRVAVIAVRDERWGERPLALIVLDPEVAGKIGAEEIQAHLRSYVDRGIIPRLAIPERILFVESLPLTAVGKIDKKVLREKYRLDEAARPAA